MRKVSLYFFAGLVLASIAASVPVLAQAFGGGGGGGVRELDQPVFAVVVGDTITAYPSVSLTYPRQLADLNPRMTMRSVAVAEATSATELSTQWPLVSGTGASILLLNGGTLECYGATDSPSALSIAATVQSNLQSIATSASGEGMRVILANIPPLEGHGTFGASNQLCFDTYNASSLSMTDVDCFVDIYSVLDTNDDDQIDAGYHIGDYENLTQSGAAAVAAEIDSVCGSFAGAMAQDKSFVMLSDGNVLGPSLSFSDDSDTGLHRYGTGAVGFVGDGTRSLIMNGTGLGIGVAPASPITFWNYASLASGTLTSFFQNDNSAGASGMYVGQSISSGDNWGALTFHGSTAAVYTGWAASQFGLRTGASGGMMLDSYNAGPIEMRANAVDMLNVTSTEFEVGGAIATSGTPTMFRTPGAAANSGITLPTCDVNAQFDQLAVDDTNDAAAAMLCWCRRGTDNSTYAWVSVHDNTTACIDP